jgi:hypothetical protein
MTPTVRHALAVALALASGAALAQPKPALVQDRDEPGRNPWQQSVSVMQNTTNCGPLLSLCTCTFDTVPAGRRLVVTHASVSFHTEPTTANPVAYTGATQVPPFSHMLPLPQARSGARHVSMGAVQYYVEAGQYPYMSVQGFPLNDGVPTQCNLSGYYVNVP